MKTAVDLAVVGSGIAGMSAAISASEAGVEPLLITDGALGRSNSVMAQGGIQIPADRSGDSALMLEDMKAVGGDDLDVEQAREFIAHLPSVADRLRSWGLEFDTTVDGQLVRHLAGGLSSPRIVTVGDEIGRPLVRVLKDLVRDKTEVVQQFPVDSLAIVDGLFHLSGEAGEMWAEAVVIATGGVAYQEAVDTGALTSNPPNSNVKLRASLDRLGLAEQEPRLFQWHPFGLVESRKGVTVSCVPESVATLGPRLVGEDGTEVTRLPAPRSTVVAAMRSWREAHQSSAVRLTLSHLSDDDLTHFPKVRRQIASYGSDPAVVPVLHYELSGYPVAQDQSTFVPGLYLAGEIVGGTHGRERLMGNGVADSLVHGHRAGMTAARWIREG